MSRAFYNSLKFYLNARRPRIRFSDLPAAGGGNDSLFDIISSCLKNFYSFSTKSKINGDLHINKSQTL